MLQIGKTGTLIMRLTLRTLLAYLDDVLEPAQTKQIGQKIQESPVAGVLVSRIREVMRRRRLSAPDVSGSHIGIDSNIVAQYLDNTLPANQVAEVERVLLSSDELLAEVAACHQVLTLVLGQPSEVSSHSRERLYALGPVSAADKLHLDDAPPTSLEVGSMATAGQPTLTAASSTTPGIQIVRPASSQEIPEYLRPNPWSKVVGPTIAVAAIMVACVGLLWLDPSFMTGLNQAQRELGKSSRGASNIRHKPAQADVADDSMETNANVGDSDSTAAMNAATNSNSTVIARLDPAPPPDEPDDTNALPNTSSKTNVPVPATVSVKPKAVIPATAVPVPPAPDRPKPVLAAPTVPVLFTSNEGVLLHFNAADQHWLLTPKQSVVKAGELLASLEPYEAALTFDQGAVRATVLGDSMVRVMDATDSAKTGLEIQRGRVLFHGSRQDPPRSTALSIVVGQDIWKLELLTPETVCALEVLPLQPLGFEKVREPNRYSSVLYVLAGRVQWTTALGATQEVIERTGLPISSEHVAGGKQAAVSFPTAPEWTDASKRKLNPLRRYATLFEKEFSLDQPAEASLLALLQHANSKVSELAVRGLALTRSYPALVQALAECHHEEGRFAARDGLYLWLPLNAEHGALLQKELGNHYPPADVEVMYRLLWGFTRDDGRDKLTSIQLVGLLRSNRVEVRELADFWIERLIGRKTEFRAVNLPNQREPQVRRIEKLIDDDGALIKGE